MGTARGLTQQLRKGRIECLLRNTIWSIFYPNQGNRNGWVQIGGVENINYNVTDGISLRGNGTGIGAESYTTLRNQVVPQLDIKIDTVTNSYIPPNNHSVIGFRSGNTIYYAQVTQIGDVTQVVEVKKV